MQVLGNQYNWYSLGLGFGSAAFMSSTDANRSYIFIHPGSQSLQRFSTAWGPNVSFVLDKLPLAVTVAPKAGGQVPIPIITSDAGSGAIVWELQVRPLRSR